MAATRAPSDTPIPSTETNQADAGASEVSEAEWTAMQTVLNNVYAYRMEDDYDPSKLFHRKVNKRAVPDYYSVIKEPMAMSTIKSKINAREYKSFAEFVRDFALIPHNAQVYNVPDSGAYQDALVIKEVIEKELKKLATDSIISEDAAELPYLGDIPPHEEVADGEDEDEDAEGEADEEEDEEDDDDDDEEDEEGGRRKKKRSARSAAASGKREPGAKGDAADKAAQEAEARRRRGRPPKVDTPMESRIKNIMKAMRKPRNTDNVAMVSHFERVPDKTQMPEYHNEIKNPIAMDVLKKRLKRKKYNSVDQFMKDVEIMFENAKSYNEDDSQIYKDAIYLQKEARETAETEKAKKDTDFEAEDGKKPMPNGILYNGEAWKVGDWVHIQNANDVTKPIVAQIYRTWEDQDGRLWINACWYYRPEQTVHRFDRHFLENEVVKTGQYRDHPVEEIVDRCFVMFVTRYGKGRPRDFPLDKEIYVCEARYNEEKHKLNKIKTWASCLPDEVREKDYVMDLYDVPKKIKKNPSPIAYLLKDDAKETDDLPKPQWGAENAPPKIGAVHKRPRDPKDSPPPEPTPTPPPQQPPPPPRQIPEPVPANMNGYQGGQRPDYNMASTSQTPIPLPTPSHSHHSQPNYTSQHHQPFHGGHSASPAPPVAQPSPGLPHSTYNQMPPQVGYPQQPAHQPHHAYNTPHAPNTMYPQRPYSQVNGMQGYQAPKVPEVYTLADNANLFIPHEIREQFQRDEQGRVLFFTAPPLDVVQPKKEGAALGHSARYLAARAKRDEMLAARRKREAEEDLANAEDIKKAKVAEDQKKFNDAAAATQKVVQAIEQQLLDATIKDLHALHGDKFDVELDKLAALQKEQIRKNAAQEERAAKEKVAIERSLKVTGLNAMLEEQ